MTDLLKQAILQEARRLGFVLAGVTTPDAPTHLDVYEGWIDAGRQAGMAYLADERARARRADPRLILPECRSILVMAVPYADPKTAEACEGLDLRGRVAAYAWGEDYHVSLPARMQALVKFIEDQAGGPVANRYYTDTGPLLERDLAQRAGLGWIGKNSCLIHPHHGSYFLLAEILLGIELEPDAPVTDHCGTCTRCIEACPTGCIRPDRTLDAGHCISYLTIENKGEIPPELAAKLGDWVFGCDVCQMVCPWNRFAAPQGDPAFAPREGVARPELITGLSLTPQEFNRKFKDSPVQRARRRGYQRNVAVALGNTGGPETLPALERAANDDEPLVREHARRAIQSIQERNR
jgi:epoxyqueuosine reductase